MRKDNRIPEEVFAQTLRTLLAPVQPFLDDPSVADILINGPEDIYVERKGRLSKTKARFGSVDELMAAIKNIAQFVGKTIDELNPLMDARLPDGSRVQVTLPPTARKGPYVSIRRFSKNLLNVDALIQGGSLTPTAVYFLHSIVYMAKNLIVAGGTGSGKTTLLNILSGLIPEDQRIAVIEDATELQLQQPHVVPMESRPPDVEGRGSVSIRDLLRASLRMRPDRIVIGEIRSAESLDLIQAMTSGHGGAMSTVHASTPRDALRRLETMAMMAEEAMPLPALRAQIASGVNVIVHASRLEDGTRRVMEISEVEGELDANGHYVVHDLFVFQRNGHDADGKVRGRLRPTGRRPTFLEELEHYIGQFDASIFDDRDAR
ncbi:CpaF family protein [Myxococcota bacterium]|nr:CpaF family protein [Myxococcota bacterium]